MFIHTPPQHVFDHFFDQKSEKSEKVGPPQLFSVCLSLFCPPRQKRSIWPQNFIFHRRKVIFDQKNHVSRVISTFSKKCHVFHLEIIFSTKKWKVPESSKGQKSKSRFFRRRFLYEKVIFHKTRGSTLFFDDFFWLSLPFIFWVKTQTFFTFSKKWQLLMQKFDFLIKKSSKTEKNVIYVYFLPFFFFL